MPRPSGICPKCGVNTQFGIQKRYPIAAFCKEDDLDETEIPEYCPVIKRYDPSEKDNEYEDTDDFIIGNYCSRCREIYPWQIQSSGKQAWSENEKKYLVKVRTAGLRSKPTP